MRKNKIVIVVALALFIMGLMPMFAEQRRVPIALDGKEIKFEVAEPFIDSNERTQTPVRHIAESLGATVEWNGAQSKAIFKKDDIILEFIIGNRDYYINGKKNTMDTEAIIIDGSTYVPVRYIAEGLGAKVEWDETKQMVNIDSLSSNIKAIEKVSYVKMTYRRDKFILENRIVKFDVNTDERASVIGETLMIPLEKFADALGGSFENDIESENCTVIIDDTTFEFEYFKEEVVVNDVSKKMEYETTVNNFHITVPITVFKDTLPSYDLSVYGNMAFKLELKEYLLSEKASNELKIVDDTVSTWIKEFAMTPPSEVDNIADGIINMIIKPSMTDVEKISVINEYIVKNTEYVYANRDLYDVFTEGKGICNGYAIAAGVLMNKAGIENYKVFGYAAVDGFADYDKYNLMNYKNNSHAWNIVKINGEYYHLDTTWNDPINKSGTIKNAANYTLLSDKEIQRDHIWIKSLYPSSDNSYYADEADKKASIEVNINSIDGAVDEDIYFQIMASSSKLDIRRMAILEKGVESKTFSIPLGSELPSNLGELDIRIIDLSAKRAAKNYNVAINNTGNVYTVNISDSKNEDITINARLESTPNEKESMNIRIMALKPSGTGYEVVGIVNQSALISPEDTVVAFILKNSFPNDTYLYTIKLTSGKGDLFFDGSGKSYSEDHKFKTTAAKINNLGIVIPTSLFADAKKTLFTNIEYTDETFKGLKDALLKAHFGDHDKLKSIKETSDYKDIESDEPNNVSKDGIVTYSEPLIGDSYIYRTYENGYLDNTIDYNITLHNIDITEENYKTFYNDMRTLLMSKIGEDSFVSNGYYDSSNNTSIDIKLEDLEDEFFNDLSKNRRQYESNYRKDNVFYQLTMYGKPYDGSIGFSIRIVITNK